MRSTESLWSGCFFCLMYWLFDACERRWQRRISMKFNWVIYFVIRYLNLYKVYFLHFTVVRCTEYEEDNVLAMIFLNTRKVVVSFLSSSSWHSSNGRKERWNNRKQQNQKKRAKKTVWKPNKNVKRTSWYGTKYNMKNKFIVWIEKIGFCHI